MEEKLKDLREMKDKLPGTSLSHALSSVADPDPGSGIGAFLTPGSEIRNRFIPDPGSQILNSYF